MSAAAHGGALWVAGGLDANGSAVDRVLVFDPRSSEWSDGPRLPRGVHHAALVSTGQDLFLVGGFTGGFPGPPSAAVYRLEASSASWVEGTPLPEPRGAGAAAWDGSRVLFAGGVSAGGVSSEIWALQDGAWARVGRLSGPREHLAATSDGNGRTWFLGGRVSQLATNVGTVDVLGRDEVTALGSILTPRSGVAAFWHPGLGACLVGGEGPSGTHDAVECVDRVGEIDVLPSLSIPRHGLGAAIVGEVAHVVLGGERPGLFVSAVVEVLPLTPTP